MIELSQWTFAMLVLYAVIGGFVVGKQLVDIVIGYINVKKAQKARDEYSVILKELQDLKNYVDGMLTK